ncbi:peptidyl-alpha-hydroxyglycine alpha-amidating lyase 1-like isoform X1 [Osmia bicornis bicornis]|uniref:peptidyl-alpha-hydroxyglycine alpha-amidating lyase 1-like isoform X1 n=1 Tax=Osmia bicornis bicornis TaxID=1437191 RepID=UPI001EAEBBAD|nr:peptidyl-alpha-hydroxyglycine alpha-amidating lyase 1-like isoform X1 [Osmia bicornis bicornis]
MMHLQHDIACCISVLFVLSAARADFQDYLNSQHRALHLPEQKFGLSEYSDNEYSDNDERDRESSALQWNQMPLLYKNGHVPKTIPNSETHNLDVLDKNIIWDSHWANNTKFGQISAVSIDPNGNIGIFHRASRIWNGDTFDNEDKFDRNKGPIREITIILLDKSGKKISEWGGNMFYLPHGLTIDSYGNYWVTDVALHQVFKFDAKDIAMIEDTKKLKKRQYNQEKMFSNNYDSNSMFQNYVPKPSLILGEAFEPGNDDKRFCKPTAVAVENDGDFFVSDGYCNSRIIKFNAKGEKILQWGRHWGKGGSVDEQVPPTYAFYVPHSLALADELKLIFVADRENGRILSFSTSDGVFHKEYKHPTIGTKIYGVAYTKDKLYLINGPDPNTNYNVHIRGFVLDIYSGNILSQFAPKHDMDRPHDIAVSDDASEIYVVELNIQTVYRFLQDIDSSEQTGNSVAHTNPRHELSPLTDTNSDNLSSGGTTTATLVLSLVTAAVIFIALCVAIAAVVARCQKRGCLLIMRKRMHWEAERRGNFKLSGLLENRRGKSFKILEKRPNPRDFSKLNTEPETSEDEHPENSFTKII